MSRISLQDTPFDTIHKMSEGNPGAMNTYMMAIEESDMSILVLLQFDTLELYGSRAYMLWNDCCQRDTMKMLAVLENWRTGKFTKVFIDDHVDNSKHIEV